MSIRFEMSFLIGYSEYTLALPRAYLWALYLSIGMMVSSSKSNTIFLEKKKPNTFLQWRQWDKSHHGTENSLYLAGYHQFSKILVLPRFSRAAKIWKFKLKFWPVFKFKIWIKIFGGFWAVAPAHWPEAKSRN